MTPAETTKVLALLKASYPRQAVGRDNMKAYALMLGDLPFADVQRAVVRHVAESNWFPSIAELREAATGAASSAPDFDEAWAEVCSEIRRVGNYGRPEFSHPAVAAAVDAVGWRNLCLSTTPGVERAAFRDCYAAGRKRHVGQVQLGRLLESGPLAPLLTEGNDDD
jgi:hypothetical protein